LPECYVERLDALKHYYYALSDLRADLVSIREGLSSPESGHLTLKHPTLSGLSEDITAAIALLERAEDKLFSLLPREEFASPTMSDEFNSHMLVRYLQPAAPTLRSAPPRGEQWLHEIKFDGWRIQRKSGR